MFKINKGLVFLVLIFFIGVALRAQELISHNFLFLLDQGRDMMAVKGILYDHHQMLIGPATSLRGVFQGPLWYYLLALFTGIFGGDPWGGILLMFVISVSVLAVVYLWMKNLFGKKVALVTTFLFAISSEAVAASTYAWNPHPMWLLIVIYIFAFYNAIYKSNKFNILLWPIIGLMFHFQTALASFILVSTLIYVFLFQKRMIFSKNFLIGVVAFLLTFAPQAIFDLRHNFLMSKSILALFSGGDRGLFVGGEKVAYIKIVSDHIFSFYNNFKSAFINDGIAGNIPDFFILLIVLGVYLAIRKSNIFTEKESIFFLFISRLLLIIFLLTFLYPFPLRYWFLTGLQSFYLLILGLLLSKLLAERFGKLAILFIFAILIFYSWQRIDTLYFNPPNDGGAQKIKGKLSGIDYIYKDSKENNFGLLIFTPAVYTYAYDYLVWWYGQRRYNYMPYKDTRGTFYLLIEKDNSKPWSYKGWLETVIKKGKILKETTLPTGLIIQKRSI